MSAILVVGCPFYSRAASLVAAWGDGAYGATTQPEGLSGVKAISARDHNLALKSDGTVVAWGEDLFGQADVPPGLSNVRAVAAGGDFSMALMSDGTITAWGGNNFGESIVPARLSGVVAIDGGYLFALALKADGTVVAWGNNSYGQTNAPPGMSNVVAIAAGENHCLALKADGTVVAWGDNSLGQTNVPGGLSNAVAVAAGGGHSLALMDNGTVVAWGDNSSGQTNVPAGLANVISIGAGAAYSLALVADGSIVAWGDDSVGQTSVPPGLTNARAIAAGYYHAAAIVPTGPVQILQDPQSQTVPWFTNITFSVSATGTGPLSYQWYYNGLALSDGTHYSGSTESNLVISNLQLADAGDYAVKVTSSFGSVVSTSAALTVINPPYFTQQPTGEVVPAGTDVYLLGLVVGLQPINYQWLLNGTNLPGATNTGLFIGNAQPLVSGAYALLASNAYGTTLSATAHLTVTDTAPYIITQPIGGQFIRSISRNLSVTAKGSMPLTYQWHFNGADIAGGTSSVLDLGPLELDQSGYYDVVIGNPVGETVSTKVLVGVVQTFVSVTNEFGAPTNVPPSLTNIVALAAGYRHVLALKSDGSLTSWGVGVDPSLTNVPAGASNVMAIAAGGNCSMVLRSNGTVFAWGQGDPDSATQTNLPSGLTNIMGIAVGGSHCLAVRSNGTVVAWGLDFAGQTDVPPGVSNVVAVSASYENSMALKSDGTVVVWGGEYGGFYNQASGPAGLSNLIAVAAGTEHALALRQDGTVVTWGIVRLPDLSNVVAIAAGDNNSVALKADGTVVNLGNQQPAAPDGLSDVVAIAAGMGSPQFAVEAVGDGSPAIVLQPVSHTASRGATASFHTRAAGVQPLTYQWQLNGVNLPGATNGTLTLTNVQGKDTGQYQATVSNAFGTVLSAIGSLSIPNTNTLATALDATNLVWQTTTSPSNAAWFPEITVTHDGVAAAQSGPIGNSQQSSLQTTVVGPGTLAFWWKVSSEDGFDLLSFSVNGTGAVPAISGEVDWKQVTVAVGPGSNTLTWTYSKDPDISVGADAGWVDQVSFTPAVILLSQPLRLADGSLLMVASDANGGQLSTSSIAGFEVQASSDLVHWVSLSNALTCTNGSLRICDTACGKTPARFYRVVGQNAQIP